MRQLVWMAEEVDWQLWNHTAQLSAMIANSNRDPKRKSKPYTANQFHPLLIAKQKRDARNNPVPITVLRDVFIDGKLPDLTEA